MIVKIKEDTIDVSKIKIIINDGFYYKITVNKFNELVINKQSDDDSSINIKPSVSNEIRIT